MTVLRELVGLAFLMLGYGFQLVALLLFLVAEWISGRPIP